MNYYNNESSSPDNEDSDEFARVNRVMLPKSSEEYRQRRERNNAAVKKSRFKSKQKTLETQKRVDQLKEENRGLERRVEALNRELNFMKAIFVPRRDVQQQQQQFHQQQALIRQSQIFAVQQDENIMNRQNYSITGHK